MSYRSKCILAYAGWDLCREMGQSGFSAEDTYDAVSAQASEYINEPYILDNAHCITDDYSIHCIPEGPERDLINLFGNCHVIELEDEPIEGIL